MSMPIIPSLIKQFCSGSGIEIGPGNNPCCSHTNTKYLERFVGYGDSTPNPDIVADAAKIPVEDGTFDFVVSCHSLEHHQNTLAAIYEWKRVVKQGGIVFIVVPHYARTFDRYRKITTLQHHIEDYAKLGDEPDYSHSEEAKEGWSKLPDINSRVEAFTRDSGGHSHWDWKFRNDIGLMHFHVWSLNEIIELLKYTGLKIEYILDPIPEKPDSVLAIGRKI